MTEEVASPCISVCTMDENSGFCFGCYRTREEIQDWWDLDNVEKRKIIAAASQRARSAFED